MKLGLKRDQQFDDSQLYYQWLHTRSAVPLKLTRFLIKPLWVIAFLFVLIQNLNTFTYWALHSVVIGLLIIIPLLITLLEFLYFVPRAVTDDSSTGFIGFIFSSPVPTGDVVSALRKFFVRFNLQIITPTITGFILATLTYSDGNVILGGFTAAALTLLCAIAVWWFMLETGIFAAALPRNIGVTGAIILIWVVPILVGVFWGGYKIASIGWDYFLGDVYVDPGFYGSGNFNEWQRTYNLRFFWYSVHYIVLLLIPTLYLFFNSNRHMELRRRGRWS